MTDLVWYCPQENKAIFRVSGPANNRMKKTHMIDDMELVVDDQEIRQKILSGSKNGSGILCPYCGHILAVCGPGVSIRDAAKDPMTMPLGSVRFPRDER